MICAHKMRTYLEYNWEAKSNQILLVMFIKYVLPFDILDSYECARICMTVSEVEYPWTFMLPLSHLSLEAVGIVILLAIH